MFSSSHKGHGSGSLQALRSRCLGATTLFIPCWVFWCCVAALVHAAWVAMLLRSEGIPAARLRPAEMRRRREAHETLRARIDSSTVWTLIFSVQVLSCVRMYFQTSFWKGPTIHEGCSGTHTHGESVVQISSGGVTRGSSMNTQEIFLLIYLAFGSIAWTSRGSWTLNQSDLFAGHFLVWKEWHHSKPIPSQFSYLSCNAMHASSKFWKGRCSNTCNPVRHRSVSWSPPFSSAFVWFQIVSFEFPLVELCWLVF